MCHIHLIAFFSGEYLEPERSGEPDQDQDHPHHLPRVSPGPVGGRD